MRDVDHKEKLLRTCKKLSDDGLPNHAVFKCFPDFKTMMDECEEDIGNSEDEFADTKGEDEEESIEIEEAQLSFNVLNFAFLALMLLGVCATLGKFKQSHCKFYL